MDDLKKLEKYAWHGYSDQTRTLDDIPRLEARDIPNDGLLPNGERVVFGRYKHTIRGDQVMQRWMCVCPYCRQPARVIYNLDNHFMCRKCTGLPYRSSISGRSKRERGIPFLPITATEVPQDYIEACKVANAKMRRDLEPIREVHVHGEACDK